MVDAVNSRGTTFSISESDIDGDPILIDGIGGFSDVDGGTSSKIEVTDLNDTAREYILGLADPGSFTLTLTKFNLDDPGQAEVYNARIDGVKRKFIMTLPATNPTLNKNVFTANVFISRMTPSGDNNSQVTGTITVEVSGLPVWS